MGRIIIILTVLMALSIPSFADGIRIPGSVKKSEFERIMREEYQMDLSGKDDADGGIENRGTELFVYTYKSLTVEQMDNMIDASARSMRE